MKSTFKSSHVDVLIIGSGPAGSMLATCLSHLGVRTRIIDKRNSGVIAGQADGISPRSCEILESLGLIYDVKKQAGHTAGASTWGPDGKGGIARKHDFGSLMDPFGEYRLHTMNQGKVERLLQDDAGTYTDIEVERCVLPTGIQVREELLADENAYPVEVTVQHLRDEEAGVAQMRAHVKGQDAMLNDGLYRSNIGPTNHTEELLKEVNGRKETEEVIHAKYVVGCDGAWSWTREQLGIKMEGAQKDAVWGVIDLIPLTDFPDARRVNTIQSENAGNILWIPRESGLVRLYTQLQEIKPGEDGRVDRSKITPDQIFEVAKKIIHPYKIDYRYCDWWTAYLVGQRVGETYTDPHRRVFLAGDAVHTHSPKEGQGMNTSMNDTFNLGWKLAAVLNKQSPSSILETYEAERRPIAQRLIEIDRDISASFSGEYSKAGGLADLYSEQAEFISGYKVTYSPSSLVSSVGNWDELAKGTEGEGPLNGHPTAGGPGGHIEMARKLTIGKRMPPVKIKEHASEGPTNLLQRAPFDGRWRLFVFAGDVRVPEQLSRVNALGMALRDPEKGLLKLQHKIQMPKKIPFPYAVGSDIGAKVQPRERTVSLIDVITVHAGTRTEIELSHFDDAFWPLDDIWGRAYDKINFGDEVYDVLGIKKDVGCMVLLRPDQHVSWIGGVEDLKGLEEFARGCFLF